MKKTLYKQLVKEVKKIEDKTYSSGYSFTEAMLEIVNKLEVKFKYGRKILSFEDDIDYIQIVYFNDITVSFYIKCYNYIYEKIIKVIVLENN